MRMKRLLALLLTLASGAVLSAAAQSPAASSAAPDGPAKIAVIEFQTAVVQSNEFQRNLADLQKKYEPKRQQLKVLSDQIDAMTKQLQAQGTTLSEAERSARASSIDTKKQQLDRDAQDDQSAFQQEMQETFTAVAAKVYDVMSEYVKQQGYTLVLDASQQQSPVLYALDSTNITKAVLDAYNAKSGVPAQAAAPSAPAPKPAAAAPRPARTARPSARPSAQH
jgi:Skp family chaperone for outer membrane proteins